MPGTVAEISTEEKIKESARVVFTRKGYAATKVRDIATEAGINVALVNYYFRSKEKLFELIMAETILQLFDKIRIIINDESKSINEKLEDFVEHYLNLLIKNPNLPLFIVNEVMSGSNKVPQLSNSGKMFLNSHFAKQLMALRANDQIKFHPANILMNLIGMIVFPFLARPIILRSGTLDAEEFKKIVEERKKLIPVWIAGIINQQHI